MGDPQQQAAERRYKERIRAKLLVRYGISAGDRTGWADSISEGGLFINTNQIYKTGTKIMVQVEFPERTLTQFGEVVWAVQVPEHLKDAMVCGMGIRFVNFDADWPAFFRRWRASLRPALAV